MSKERQATAAEFMGLKPYPERDAPATPKPRAGEHTPETDAHVKWMREEGSSSSCLPELALAEFARRIEVERDLSFSREAQLVTALRGIVRRYEAQWSDEPEELSAARALLAKHGR